MITPKLFDRLFPARGLDPRRYNLVRERGRLIDELNRTLPKYGITTHKRIAAFLANCGIETDYFKTTIEYASGSAYEGRKDLGNIRPGDGRRFKGRGLTQTTGRFNYGEVQRAIGNALGVDVVANPELLARVDIAVESACIFWRDNDLNRWADFGDFRALSGIVNRGDRKKTPLHWPKRLALYKECLEVIPKDIGPTSTAEPIEPAAPETGAPEIATVGASIAAASAPVADPQISLQAISNKYLRHTPADTVKNIGVVVGGRVTTGLTAVWSSGIGGKVFTFLIIAAVLGPLAYALYYYRWRMVGWAQTIADGILNPANG